MMEDLIAIFRMKEISKKTRCNLIFKMGTLINHKYGSNITEPLVVELVMLLNPNHPELSKDHYKKYLTTKD